MKIEFESYGRPGCYFGKVSTLLIGRLMIEFINPLRILEVYRNKNNIWENDTWKNFKYFKFFPKNHWYLTRKKAGIYYQ